MKRSGLIFFLFVGFLGCDLTMRANEPKGAIGLPAGLLHRREL